MTDDACRVYDVDGESIRVHGGEPMDEAGQAALGAKVKARLKAAIRAARTALEGL